MPKVRCALDPQTLKTIRIDTKYLNLRKQKPAAHQQENASTSLIKCIIFHSHKLASIKQIAQINLSLEPTFVQTLKASPTFAESPNPSQDYYNTLSN